jgi:tetratricopeptide (TPR) repeat protein
MGIYEDSLTAFRSGDTALAEDLALELLGESSDEDDECEDSGHRAGRVDALCMLARVALRRGEFWRVSTLADDAWGVSLGAVNRREEVMLKRMPIHLMAVAARMRREYAEARLLYLESIDLNRELGEDRMVAAEHRNLAYVELHDGHMDRARELFASAVELARASNYATLEPYLLQDAAVLAFEDGDRERAAELVASTQAAFLSAGQIPDPDDLAELEALQSRLRRNSS